MSTNRTIRMRAVAALAAVAVATFAGNIAGAAAPPPPAGPPTQLLEQRMHGEAAIRALGSRLPDAASRNGLSADELRRRLRADDMLAVSEDGTLLFVDQGLADHAEPATSAVTDPAWLTRSPAEAFTLHSRPGASRVIHLDFDGHDPSTSAWTDKTYAQPWDDDRNPSTYSDAERRMIIEVWQRVAEDFAPFAIDVTTQDPGVDAIRRTDAADATFGTRVVVTPTATNCAGCGGITYVGTYDAYGGSATQGWTHDRYQPAFVYPNGWSAKSIAEAASHEAGHTLGLSHDGTASIGYYSGHGDWAPIMGVGYYEEISQWSRGEYAGANNAEDDFAVVADNGGPSSVDDHGGTAATATALSPTIDLAGEIGSRTDLDAFSFTTAGGALSLGASPVSAGANLDLALRLVRDDGTVIADVDVAGLSTTLDLTLAAGTYVVLVDGVGTGDAATTGYSDYASVGRYRLTGSLPAALVNRAPTASVQASTTSGIAPLSVTFDGGGSSDPDGTPLSHRWSFGDGTTASGPTVTRAFTSAGTHVVTLTVSDGTLSATATTTITVSAPPTVVTTPSKPTVTATPASGAVTLDWGDDASVTAYDVYRETQHKNGSYRSRTLLTTLTTAVSTWVDRPGTGTFRYQVVARNAAGSATSDPLIVTVASTGTKPKRTPAP